LFGNLEQIEAQPGPIVGPLAWLFGAIFNAVFNFVYMFAGEISLGLSVIVLTLIMKSLLLPLGIKSQKSTMKMQRVAPEVNAIKKKYEGKSDPELKRKMQIEIQQVYSKNNISLLSGCLPALATMPVFIGLNFIMRRMFRYVDKVGEVYSGVSEFIIGIAARSDECRDAVMGIIHPLVPSGWVMNFGNVDNMNQAINKFTSKHWDQLRDYLSECADSVSGCVHEVCCSDVLAELNTLIADKSSIETFFGLNMVSIAGWSFPGIIIPILSVAATALSSYLMQKSSVASDPSQAMQRRIMLIVMPIFIGFLTINMPIGVGLYWVTSNIYQVGQYYILGRYYLKRELI
jgi:YidC/Oxa1 family membrane protein insertase